MATERDAAIQSIVATEISAPEKFTDAISAGEQTKRLELAHEHELNMHRAELGWFGIVFGGEAHAAIVIAFFVVIVGLVGAIGLWVAAYRTGKSDFWSSEAHIALGAATTALGYVFGRGSKDSPDK
jgi:hypothetical protein